MVTLFELLEDSKDAYSIALECDDSFNGIINMFHWYEDKMISKKELYKMIAQDVQRIYEAGYNVGYQNAQADEGLSLVEQD